MSGFEFTWPTLRQWAFISLSIVCSIVVESIMQADGFSHGISRLCGGGIILLAWGVERLTAHEAA